MQHEQPNLFIYDITLNVIIPIKNTKFYSSLVSIDTHKELLLNK